MPIFLILRHINLDKAQKQLMESICNSRVGQLTYRHMPEKLNEANCVTAVRDIFDSAGLPLKGSTWVGSFPRYLYSLRKFHVLQQNTDDLETGDVLFVKSFKTTRLISHVALICNNCFAYHCIQSKGSVIEPLDDFLKTFTQKITQSIDLLSYEDPRSDQILSMNVAPIEVSHY